MLAPVVFAGRLVDGASLRAEVLMAAAFCLLASAGYALNDLHDAAADAQHPAKAGRPLASRSLPRSFAWATGLACAAAGLLLGAHVQRLSPPGATGLSAVGPFGWCLAYLALTTSYTLVLRAVAGLDVLVLAIGFVLRAYAGSAALQILPSHWLVTCGFSLALFLAMGKRRLESSQRGAEASAGRPSLAGWEPRTLDRLVDATALLAVLSYAAYTLAPDTAAKIGGRGLALTVPIVAWLVARARNRLRRDAAADPVELLLRDGPTLLGFLGWAAIVLLVVYRRPW